jgi:hypothetical protein
MLPPDEIAALPMKVLTSSDAINMLELGNKKNSTGLYRDFYAAINPNIDYTCLDWNGEDGAVPLDMRYPLEPQDVVKNVLVTIERGFDLVTNFGFSEHVDDQLTCWHNINSFVNVGGWLSICMPLMPWWKGHGLWMPTVEWYQRFAELNGYLIVYEKVWDRVRPTYVAKMQKTGDCNIFEMPVGMIEKTGGVK